MVSDWPDPRLLKPDSRSLKSPVKAKESVGQKIECMDGNFEVHQCCLVNSDILWDFFEGIIQY